MSVRARMVVLKVQGNSPDNSGRDTCKIVRMSPVYSPDPNSPNYSYSVATPAGEVCLYITNPAAFEQFKEGKTYDLTFEEYVEPPADEAKAEEPPAAA